MTDFVADYSDIQDACEVAGVSFSSVVKYIEKTGETAQKAIMYFIEFATKYNPRWESWEDSVLMEEYESLGSDIPGLAHRSANSISKRAHVLGFKYVGTTSGWSTWEDDILREKYPLQGSDILELDRSCDEIRYRARLLGVKRAAHWSEDELAILREKYPEIGVAIPELLTRSATSIRNKAYELGIAYSQLWSQEHIELLKKCYPTMGFDIPELRAIYTDSQIKNKVLHLHLRRADTPDSWTEEEDNILRDRYPICGFPIPELSNRSEAAIRKRAKYLGVKHSSRWSEEHILILKEKYPYLGPDIPELLEVYSRDAIINQANRRGLRNETRNIRWSEEEKRIVVENSPIMSVEELCELLPGRTVKSIQHYISKVGLIKDVAHSNSLKNKCIGIPKAPPDGYIYVKCSKCGRIFVQGVDTLAAFSHETHKFPIPDGWFAPAAYTKVV